MTSPSLTKAQVAALLLMVKYPKVRSGSRTKEDAYIDAGALATVNHTVSAKLQRLGLAKRVFSSDNPTIATIIFTPVDLEITAAGRVALLDAQKNGRPK